MVESQLFTIGQVAVQVGEAPWRLAYLIARGDLPGPSITVPGRRLFSNHDIELIRDALRRRAATKAVVRRTAKHTVQD
jgi:hypothetical protein